MKINKSDAVSLKLRPETLRAKSTDNSFWFYGGYSLHSADEAQCRRIAGMLHRVI